MHETRSELSDRTNEADCISVSDLLTFKVCFNVNKKVSFNENYTKIEKYLLY